MKPLVLDPEGTFPVTPESMGDDPPTFHLHVLTKSERDGVFIGPAMDSMLEQVKSGGKIDDDAAAGLMTSGLMKELQKAIPNLGPKILKIENITVSEKGEEKHYPLMDERDRIEQVYNVLDIMAEMELRMALMVRSFMSREEETALESPPSS